MKPEEMKRIWQSQTTPRRLSIDAEVLLRQVQRSAEDFKSTIFRRDLVEAGGSLLMVPFWIWLGWKEELPWSWYLAIPGLLWVAGFLIVDRVRQRRQQPRLDDPLRECLEGSLNQVQHQIWLLRNVTWWYLMPLSLGVIVFFIHISWQIRETAWLAVGMTVVLVGFAVGVDVGVYYLNQYAVRHDLEPRATELEAMLRELVES